MAERLTKAEEEIMRILWSLGEGTVRDVISKLNDPGVPYTTVSTVIRVLEKKGFADHRAVGTTYLYRPVLKKKEYLRGQLTGIARNYFNGSLSRMTAFFARETDMNLRELKEILDEMDPDANLPDDE